VQFCLQDMKTQFLFYNRWSQELDQNKVGGAGTAGDVGAAGWVESRALSRQGWYGEWAESSNGRN